MRRKVLSVVLIVVVAGCARTDYGRLEEGVYLDIDTPLEFRLNAKNQVWLKDRWHDLFGQQAHLRSYLQTCSTTLQERFAAREIPLAKRRLAGREVTLLPVPVIVEVDAKTKSGALSAFRRVCREYGFVDVVVKPTDEHLAASQ